jgi:hypothetical protein
MNLIGNARRSLKKSAIIISLDFSLAPSATSF